MRQNRPLPKLPDHVQRAIERDHWTPELSLEADRAIQQCDRYYELEFVIDRGGAR